MPSWSLRLLLLVILFGAGWGAGSVLRAKRRPDWNPGTHKLRVLTTIFPLYDFAREVGGDSVEVRNLLPPGVDPHEYALSPSDVSLVAHADLLIANGRGLDDFLAEALRKAGASGRNPIYCAEGLPVLKSGSGDDHDHESGDPHLWLDPYLARDYVRKMASAIAGELKMQGKGVEAGAVEQRAKNYERQLLALDAQYRSELGGHTNQAFIAFHSAYGYLAARYGLTMAGVWQPSPGHEPGPREVAKLIDLARAKRVSVFFSEPGFSPRAVETIAHDAGLPVRPLDPLETAEDFSRTHYLETMRANLSTLVSALRR